MSEVNTQTRAKTDAKLRLADMLIARDKRLIGWLARGKASDIPNQTYAEYLSEAEGMLEEIEGTS